MEPFSFEDLDFEFVSMPKQSGALEQVETLEQSEVLEQSERLEDLATARNQRALDAANNDEFWDGE